LCVFAIVFGIFPYQFPGGRPSILKYMDATIESQVEDLAEWTRETEAARTTDRPASAAQSPSAPAQTVSTTTGF